MKIFLTAHEVHDVYLENQEIISATAASLRGLFNFNWRKHFENEIIGDEMDLFICFAVVIMLLQMQA